MWYYIIDGVYSSIYLIGVNKVKDVIYIPLEDVEVIFRKRTEELYWIFKDNMI